MKISDDLREFLSIDTIQKLIDNNHFRDVYLALEHYCVSHSKIPSEHTSELTRLFDEAEIDVFQDAEFTYIPTDFISDSEEISYKYFEVPKGVTKIRSFAFINANSLEEITLPDTIRLIETKIFTDMAPIDTIIYEGTMDQWRQIIKADHWGDNIIFVRCDDGEITY